MPIRRDETECVMTAVPRLCFALAPLFQKSDPAKSEIRKKRNLFFFLSPFFPSFHPCFRSKRQNDILDQKKGPFSIEKFSFFINIFLFFTGPLQSKWHNACTGHTWMMTGMMRVSRQTGNGPRPMHSDPCSGSLPLPLPLPFALRCGRGGGVGVGCVVLCL